MGRNKNTVANLPGSADAEIDSLLAQVPRSASGMPLAKKIPAEVRTSACTRVGLLPAQSVAHAGIANKRRLASSGR